MKNIILLISIAFFSLSLGAQNTKKEGDVLMIGETMPNFSLLSAKYGNVKSADLKGKVVLVALFATWYNRRFK